MKYVDDYDVEFAIPRSVRRTIEREYIQKTYYWSLGLGCFIIGLLIGASI